MNDDTASPAEPAPVLAAEPELAPGAAPPTGDDAPGEYPPRPEPAPAPGAASEPAPAAPSVTILESGQDARAAYVGSLEAFHRAFGSIPLSMLVAVDKLAQGDPVIRQAWSDLITRWHGINANKQ